MRILAVMFGAAAVLAVAAPVAADPGTGRHQLAQAQDSGSQSGSSTGARKQGSSGSQQGSSGMSQQGSSGQGGSGSAASGGSSGGGSAATNQTQGTSRTTVRGRSAGARIAVHSGSRTAVGVRHAGASDDVIIRRKKARRYVYQEPSTTVVRKLVGTPLRRAKPSLICVAVISKVSPLNLPSEKPSQECFAYCDGRGRPSSQIIRSPGVFSYDTRYASS